MAGMIPTPTVENYLKAIVIQQQSAGGGLVPMGQIAGALGVTPGSATTMVKALAESGLVAYEPYSGAKLTPSGERLARLVLRRHRLVELFLVQVMNMRWDEVHEEAEHLEHVVSDRLIERMDEMLGRPKFDPHGDPIPDAEGAIRQRTLLSLLDCPVERPVIVRRIVDQDAAFLRFVENHQLKPGESIVVEARDPMADSVRVRRPDAAAITIGARAASKLLVEVALLVLSVLLLTGTAWAGDDGATKPARDSHRPFEILDNSFLVEEAFNQEPRIFQNIFGFVRNEGDWSAAFTQEWPAPGVRHQLSYTLTFSNDLGTGRFSDVAINYRYQLLEGENGGTAIAPRLSLLMRTKGDDGPDYGNVGLQANLPVSRQFGDVFVHGNAGITIYPTVSTSQFPSTTPPLVPARDVALVSPFFAGSAILRVRPMLHLMLESVLQFDEDVKGPGLAEHDTLFTLSPGARFGWNLGDQQLILGFAVPVVHGRGSTDAGVLCYASWELPFKH
jgi:DtxR family Mn-dependent transcriptional regulator